MQDLNPQQKKMLRLAKLIDKKEVGIAEELDSIDSKVHEVENKAERAISIAEETQKMDGKVGEKGEKGDSPTSEEIVSLIKPLIPKPIKGDKGDKGDSIVVEKIIEKTEIVREKPTITEVKTETFVENKDTGEQIITKINEDKKSLIKRSKIEGLEERLLAIGERVVKGSGIGISQNNSNQTSPTPSLQQVTDVGSTTSKELLASPLLQEKFIEGFIKKMESEGYNKDLIIAMWHRGWGNRSKERLNKLLSEPLTKKYLNNRPK